MALRLPCTARRPLLPVATLPGSSQERLLDRLRGYAYRLTIFTAFGVGTKSRLPRGKRSRSRPEREERADDRDHRRLFRYVGVTKQKFPADQVHRRGTSITTLPREEPMLLNTPTLYLKEFGDNTTLVGSCRE